MSQSLIERLESALQALTPPATYQSEHGWGFEGCEADVYENEEEAKRAAEESVADPLAEAEFRKLAMQALPDLLKAALSLELSQSYLQKLIDYHADKGADGLWAGNALILHRLNADPERTKAPRAGV